MSYTYPKIETLFTRDERLKVTSQLTRPEFGLINEWLVTEKIDGMNVRVSYFPVALPPVQFGGRSDDAMLRDDLSASLCDTFTAEALARVIPGGGILYGEGYGLGIRGGGKYRPAVGFRLFDVLLLRSQDTPIWMNWTSVEDIAQKLGVETVPVLGRMPLAEAVKATFGASVVARAESDWPLPTPREGVVARTDPLLCLREGWMESRNIAQRLMWKLKAKDFPEGCAS